MVALQQKKKCNPWVPQRQLRSAPLKTEGIKKKIQAMQSRRRWGLHLQPTLPLPPALWLATHATNCCGLSGAVGACGRAGQSPRAWGGCGVGSIVGDEAGGEGASLLKVNFGWGGDAGSGPCASPWEGGTIG